MSDIALRTVGLGKMYLIGSEREKYRTLRDTLAHAAKRPIERIRHPGAATHTSEELWALRDIDLEVKQGDVLGIIGRNGSGKSTLLKVLSRITEPTEGRVEIKGRVASLLEVGTGFHPELTGRENIQLNGVILGMTRADIKGKFDEIVEFSEISRFLDTPVKHYSSGMYVRLAFAVAAHLEPEILLVDEVLAVGDVAFQKKCLGKMGEVGKEGRTVLFVSHNLGAVSSLCDHGVVLDEGRIQCDGRIDSVVSHYLNAAGSVDYSGNLVDHPNRTRGLKPLLRAFEVDSDNGAVYYSEPVTLRIGYQFPNRIAVPQFCASFLNEQGIVAFTVISDYQPNDIPPSLQGMGWVECRIRSLPLLPGSYTVNLRLWQPGEKLDDIENVARVTVEWMDRELGQFNWGSGMGVVYVDATWSMVSGESGHLPHEGPAETASPLGPEADGIADASVS